MGHVMVSEEEMNKIKKQCEDKTVTTVYQISATLTALLSLVATGWAICEKVQKKKEGEQFYLKSYGDISESYMEAAVLLNVAAAPLVFRNVSKIKMDGRTFSKLMKKYQDIPPVKRALDYIYNKKDNYKISKDEMRMFKINYSNDPNSQFVFLKGINESIVEVLPDNT